MLLLVQLPAVAAVWCPASADTGLCDMVMVGLIAMSKAWDSLQVLLYLQDGLQEERGYYGIPHVDIQDVPESALPKTGTENSLSAFSTCAP